MNFTTTVHNNPFEYYLINFQHFSEILIAHIGHGVQQPTWKLPKRTINISLLPPIPSPDP